MAKIRRWWQVGVAGALLVGAVGCGSANPTSTSPTTRTTVGSATTQQTLPPLTTATTEPPTTTTVPTTAAPPAAQTDTCAAAINQADAGATAGSSSASAIFGPAVLAACPSISVFNAAIAALNEESPSDPDAQSRIMLLDDLLHAVCVSQADAESSSLCASLNASGLG